jgi:hypothetical protein
VPIALCRNVLKLFYRERSAKALFGSCHDKEMRGGYGHLDGCGTEESNDVVIIILLICVLQLSAPERVLQFFKVLQLHHY